MLGTEQAQPTQYSRRGFLERTVRTTAALAAAPIAIAILEGCGPHAVKPEIYDGPIEYFHGKTLMSEARFSDVTKSMRESGSAFLDYVQEGIVRLHTKKSNPGEFGSMISEDSTPLMIAEYPGGVAFSLVVRMPGTEEGFKLRMPEQDLLDVPYQLPFNIGIEVGVTDAGLSEGPLNEGILLGKEYLSLMLSIRLASEYERFLQGYDLLDKNAEPMHRQEDRDRAGFTVIMNLVTDTSSTFHQTVDVLPVLMLAPEILDLVEAGKLPRNTSNLGHIYNSMAVLYENPVAWNKIMQIRDSFMLSGSQLGGSDLFDLVTNPDVQNVIQEYQKVMYPNGPIQPEN